MREVKYKTYPEYKDSEIEWLEALPSHWDVKKLKFISNVQPSNVDKKTKEGEISVLLCNYTDVYYNDSVGLSMEFMKATATDEQIGKFTLKAGDIIITKDSEDPTDIAIPTFVPEDMPGVVCGYHLSMIRSFKNEYSAYIKRVFESNYANAYFTTRSNGLTRYGLGTYPLENVYFPKPSEDEAIFIAGFLDHETAKIDTLIEKQKQLIKLLKEKRQAVISHAVTKGLNPDAPMKDSGVEWLGEVPKHWKLWKFAHFAPIITCGIASTPTYVNEDEGMPFLSAQNIRGNKLSLHKYNYITHELHEQLTRNRQPERGDLLVTRVGAGIGDACIIDIDMEFSIYVSLTHIRVNPKIANNKFIMYFFGTDYCQFLNHQGTVTGGGVGNLNVQNVLKYQIPLPCIDEQQFIVDYIEIEDAKFDKLVEKAEQVIGLLQERRTALISAAVTGKIDVRGWKKPGDIT